MKIIKFRNVYINDHYLVLGSIQNSPSIIKEVDKVLKDYYVNKKTPEEGESEYQNIAISGILKKINKPHEEIDLLIGSDLQNQILSSTYNASLHSIPFLGIYSACASFVEGLIIGSSMVSSKQINNSLVITSSSNLTSEKQYRYPVEYGALRKKINTYTATGSACAYISREKSNIKIENALIGKVIDLDYNDANHMGAVMAPAVAETLYEYLKETKTNVNDYDVILTGDLGVYGIEILKEYMKTKYNIFISNIEDAGSELYSSKIGSDIAGGSGPVCAPFVLFSKTIKKYKNILLLASGSLHSAFSSNLKKSIPSISHAINLKVIK